MRGGGGVFHFCFWLGCRGWMDSAFSPRKLTHEPPSQQHGAMSGRWTSSIARPLPPFRTGKTPRFPLARSPSAQGNPRRCCLFFVFRSVSFYRWFAFARDFWERRPIDRNPRSVWSYYPSAYVFPERPMLRFLNPEDCADVFRRRSFRNQKDRRTRRFWQSLLAVLLECVCHFFLVRLPGVEPGEICFMPPR